MSFKILLSILLGLPTLVSAQLLFKDAEIIDRSGKITATQIEIKNWDNNPKFFMYQDKGQSTSVKIGVDDVKQISIGNERKFERAIINKSLNKIKYPDLPKYADSTSVKDTVFLELIYLGDKVSLYSYTDDIKKRFYIKTNTSDYQELKYRSFYSAEIDFKVQNQNIFRDQLKNLAIQKGNNDKANLKKIEALKYSLNDMMIAMNLINVGQSKFESKLPSSGFNFIVGAGVNFGAFKIQGKDVFSNSKASNPISVFPVIGLNYSIDKNKNKSVLQITLSGSKEDVSFYGIDNHSEQTKSFSQLTFSLSPIYLYNFYQSESINAFFGSGLSANIQTFKNDILSWKSTEIPNAKPVVRNDVGGFQNFGFSIPVKAGIGFKNIQLLAGYSYFIGGISDSNEFSISKNNFNLSVQYIFKKNY
jgi:hypothetical protein